uniref:RING-type E3 ubiquitin transferase n=1 Tax=Amphilophus citrinellus TaxID=61819 RepID=A0A3Q0R9N0_AMPCI
EMGDFPVNPLVVIGVGSSLAFSGLFYHLYKEKEKELKELKASNITAVNFKPKDLRFPSYLVQGQVQADGEPLASQFIPRCFGVIQKISAVEHWKYWDSITNNSVPFSLISQGAYISDISVRVHNPLEASGCFMERVYYKMRHAEEALVNVLLLGLTREKPVAMEETEEMLRVGSNMTGFGEVVLEGGQVMRLQAPRDGRKYILVPSDHKSFMDSHESSASMWKTLSALTGITGASVLALKKKKKKDIELTSYARTHCFLRVTPFLTLALSQTTDWMISTLLAMRT